MTILYAGGFVLLIVTAFGILQTLGETRLAWISPFISMAVVLFFLARCMFLSTTRH